MKFVLEIEREDNFDKEQFSQALKKDFELVGAKVVSFEYQEQAGFRPFINMPFDKVLIDLQTNGLPYQIVFGCIASVKGDLGTFQHYIPQDEIEV